VIIPAHNEEGNLPPLIDRIYQTMGRTLVPYEIVIVNDHSEDDTLDEVRSLARSHVEILAVHNDGPKGMGNALKMGINEATGDVLTFVMADGVDPIENLPGMLRTLEERKLDVLISSRYLRNQDLSGVSFSYVFWSRMYRFLARILLGLTTKDPTNAFRMVRRSFFECYTPRAGGFAFSAEVTLEAFSRGLRIGEIPGPHGRRTRGRSSFKFRSVAIPYVSTLIRAFLAKPIVKKARDRAVESPNV